MRPLVLMLPSANNACLNLLSGLSAPIYGCKLGPYMDASSICKSAIAAKTVSADSSSTVTFELVEPVEAYEGCTMNGFKDIDDPSKGRVTIVSDKWIWWKWRYPERPENIKRYCDPFWVEKNPGIPCDQVKQKFRTQCQSQNSCFGMYAFTFLEPAPAPVLTAREDTLNGHGSYDETAIIDVAPGEDDPTTYMVCTTDGSPADLSTAANKPRVTGPITLSAGTWVVKCAAGSATKGPSRTVKETYVVLPRLPLPVIHPARGDTFVDEVVVSLDSGEPGATVLFTLDGSDPGDTSDEYSEPFVLNTIGTTVIKGKSVKEGWADSHTAEATLVILERTSTPTFSPPSGTFIDSATVQLECQTEGADMRYTTDGTEPSEASAIYKPEVGIVLPLPKDGAEHTYVLRAMAFHPPDKGPSYVAISGPLVVQPQVETPIISPDVEGPYVDRVQVEIECGTKGASIHYSVDGTVPTTASPLYDPSKPLVIDATNTIVKAIALAPHMADSAMVESVPFRLAAFEPFFLPGQWQRVWHAQERTCAPSRSMLLV
jgi:hypothetical protein